jgi:putative nucleotidyltransferase with HDIG domain
MDAVQELLGIIERIAKGHYSNDIMALTTDDQPETVRTIAEAIGLMMVKIEAREYQLEMLVEELKGLNRKIKENVIKTVSAMAQALAARDAYTEGHAGRVGQLAADLARALGLNDAEAESVRLAGILHDLGKIGFPDVLFQAHEGHNPPPLVKQITKHPAVGAEILRELDFLGASVEYVHCHHERLDGKGYPRHLKAEDIPLGARIVAVADGFDSMTTDRPYQKGMSLEGALGILRQHAGIRWDPACIDALSVVLESRGLTKGEKSAE